MYSTLWSAFVKFESVVGDSYSLTHLEADIVHLNSDCKALLVWWPVIGWKFGTKAETIHLKSDMLHSTRKRCIMYWNCIQINSDTKNKVKYNFRQFLVLVCLFSSALLPWRGGIFVAFLQLSGIFLGRAFWYTFWGTLWVQVAITCDGLWRLLFQFRSHLHCLVLVWFNKLYSCFGVYFAWWILSWIIKLLIFVFYYLLTYWLLLTDMAIDFWKLIVPGT